MITLKWKVDRTVPAECPDYKPDPYTGEYPRTHCLVYHCKTITEGRVKEFGTKEEADQFKKNAPFSCYDWEASGVSTHKQKGKKT